MTPRPAHRDLLQLFGLHGFAVAGPVLELLDRSPGFLVAHDLGGDELALLVLALLLPAPVAAWGVERAAAGISPRLAAGLHLLLCGLLVGLAASAPLVRLFPEAGAALLWPAAGAVGAAAALALSRSEYVRQLASATALAPLAFAAAFWFSRPISALRHPAAHADAGAAAPPGRSPIVWIVLDELPLVSLLDAGGGIDASRYPAFAALAEHAIWFRNTAAVAETTEMAVPAIVTGSYPERSALPVLSDHPQNLFTWLERSYEIHALEERTRLVPGMADAKPSGRRDLRVLLSDVAVAFAHIVTPADAAAALPAVTLRGRGFASEAGEEIRPGLPTARSPAFRRFVGEIPPCASACLHFAHLPLPHVPWNLMPSGRLYEPARVFGIDREDGRWRDDDAWVLQGYQRHLLQLAWVDALLGRLLARLEKTGLYDAALLVVTADHGAAFWPGSTRRLLAGHPHPEDILRVPLFVKRPGQRRGEIRDAPISTVDILPTVAELAGGTLPWPVDGRSAAAPDFPGRAVRSAFDGQGRRLDFDAAALDIRASLERKLAAFGSGDGEAGLFAFGDYGAIVGRDEAEVAAAAPAGLRIRVAAEPFARASRNAERDQRLVPVRLFGIAADATPLPMAAHVAVAADGVIRATAPTYPMADGRLAFTLLVPEDALARGRGSLEIALVTGPTTAPLLRPGRVEFGAILQEIVGFEWRRPPPDPGAAPGELP